eukprot:TRINITY_DN4516_c0_g1_i3.p1 TRINITY_DN4516_c0_g1~~TRINITY_DN4516_c0_g1_i3.p1  ORF type:complete len:1532 (-),score=273.36 TRINITY_DN4516_c0_g1_i3:6-4601(-)
MAAAAASPDTWVGCGEGLQDRSPMRSAVVATAPPPPQMQRGGATKPRARSRKVAQQQATERVRDMSVLKAVPIWLGSGSKETDVEVEAIQQVVSEDLRHDESVLAVSRLELEASAREEQQKFVAAAECLEQAIALRRKLLGDGRPGTLQAIERFAMKCNLWGIQSMASGQHTSSLELLRKAQDIAESESVPNFERRVSLRAATLNNLCCYFRQRGKLNAALQYAEKALNIEQRYKEADGQARTHLNYAVLLSMMNRHKQAIENIELAIAVLNDEDRELACQVIDSSTPEDRPSQGAGGRPRRRKEVASVLVVAYYNMWVEYWRQGRREQSMDYILRAASVARRSLGTTHPLSAKTEDTLYIVQEQLAKGPGLSLAAAVVDGTEGLPEHGPGMSLTSASAVTPRPHEQQHPHLHDVTDLMPQLTFRYQHEYPKPPPPRAHGEATPFKRKKQQLGVPEHVYGRVTPTVQAETIADQPIFQTRAKTSLEKRRIGGAFAGSPALQQQLHGARPRSQSGHRRPGSAPCGTLHSADGAATGPGTSGSGPCGAAGSGGAGPGFDAPNKFLPEASTSHHLRAVYEYYRLQTQQRANDPRSCEASTAPDSDRLGAVAVLRDRLTQRRDMGLGLPTDFNRVQAATRIQARFRGYSVRLWSIRELAAHAWRLRDGAATTEEQQFPPLPSGDDADCTSAGGSRQLPPAPSGPPDMKRRVALRVVYAARRAFMEYSSAVRIQKLWRGCRVRREIHAEVAIAAHASATKLQALFRRVSLDNLMRLRGGAAVVIQRCWRRWMAIQRAGAMRVAKRSIVRMIQCTAVRRRINTRKTAVRPLQTAARGFLAHRRLCRRQDGARRFERAWRGWRARSQLLRQNAAASRIAGLWRGYAMRRRFQKRHEVASVIQRRFRIYRMERWLQVRHAAVSTIAAMWTGYRARRVRPWRATAIRIQAWVRGGQARKRIRRQPLAAKRIQREFDLTAKAFVSEEDGGFVIPESKARVSYRSRNELLVGSDFGDGSMTASGYPRTVRAWQRGTPLSKAELVYEGNHEDVSVSGSMFYNRGHWHEFRTRALTFFTSKKLYRPGDPFSSAQSGQPFVELPVPDDATTGTFADACLIKLRSNWKTLDGATYKAGSLLSICMKDLVSGDFSKMQVLFEPEDRRSLPREFPAMTRNYLVVTVLDNVRKSLQFWEYEGEGRFLKRSSDDACVQIGCDISVSAVWGHDCDDIWIMSDGYLQPDTLQLADAKNCAATPEDLKAKPSVFDIAGLTVDQRMATSLDGTKVPYYIVHRCDLALDGSTPTVLDGYGGFQISRFPVYSTAYGVGWLERGGAYVVANIRGGGEFGPSWHQAAKREKRHKAYEDFEAVARDLIQSGITSPGRLACVGGSNGGMLVGNMLTREGANLFGAIVCRVPLLDMWRYNKLLAGASWVAEYGNPDKPDDWSFLRAYSPYHTIEDVVKAGSGWGGCPAVLFTTSTKDDRVHPAHARKMVRKLLGLPECADKVFYWENIEGGHGGAANNEQTAYMWALIFSFLFRTIGQSEH